MLTEIYDEFAKALALKNADITIAYPNIQEKPVDGLWLELRAVYNENFELGVNAPTVEQGFFRVVICTRLNTGIMTAQAKAEEVVNQFPKGTTFGDAFVERTPSTMGPIILEREARIEIPVTVRWRAVRSQ